MESVQVGVIWFNSILDSKVHGRGIDKGSDRNLMIPLAWIVLYARVKVDGTCSFLSVCTGYDGVKSGMMPFAFTRLYMVVVAFCDAKMEFLCTCLVNSPVTQYKPAQVKRGTTPNLGLVVGNGALSVT